MSSKVSSKMSPKVSVKMSAWISRSILLGSVLALVLMPSALRAESRVVSRETSGHAWLVGRILDLEFVPPENRRDWADLEITVAVRCPLFGSTPDTFLCRSRSLFELVDGTLHQYVVACGSEPPSFRVGDEMLLRVTEEHRRVFSALYFDGPASPGAELCRILHAQGFGPEPEVEDVVEYLNAQHYLYDGIGETLRDRWGDDLVFR